MTSSVEICNLALSHVRGGSINSLTESSLQAQQCTLFYNLALKQALSEATWGFNHKLDALAELSSVEVFNWVHVWVYPSDCLHINRLVRNIEDVSSDTEGRWFPGMRPEEELRVDQMPAVEYQIFNVAISGNDTRVIATLEDDLRADYRKLVTDANLFPANFVMGLSFLLAHYLALPIAGQQDGKELKRDCFAEYELFKRRAMDHNSSQQHRHRLDSEFITIRG